MASLVDLTSSSSLGDDSSSHWAFRCLIFYCYGSVEVAPNRHLSTWTMRLAQTHITSGEWRFLAMRPDLKFPDIHSGEGFSSLVIAELPSSMPPQFVKDTGIKLWASPSYKRDVGSDKAERVEYTHRDLLNHLNDPSFRERLLRNCVRSEFSLCENLVQHLVDLRIIAPESLQTLITIRDSLEGQKFDIPIIPYNTVRRIPPIYEA